MDVPNQDSIYEELNTSSQDQEGQEPLPAKRRTLTELCIDQLSASGCRTVFRELHRLPDNIVDRLLVRLADDNTLTDNIALRTLTKARTYLSWEGCTMLRRSVFFEVPRSCPNLTELRLQRCKQIGNGVVRAILANCRQLRVLRLDGCRNISDAAFATRPFNILHGLLGLRALGLSQCPQITSLTLETIVKNCPQLEELYLSQNRHFDNSSVTDILESCRSLRTLDLGHCTRLTPDLFYALGGTQLIGDSDVQSTNQDGTGHFQDAMHDGDGLKILPRQYLFPELSLESLSWAHRSTSPKHLRYIALAAPKLQHLDLRWTKGLTDEGLRALLLKTFNPVKRSLLQNGSNDKVTATDCFPFLAEVENLSLPFLQSICLRGCSEISNDSVDVLSHYRNLKRVDLAWCLNISPSFILRRFALHQLHYLNISFCCPVDKFSNISALPLSANCLHHPTGTETYSDSVTTSSSLDLNSCYRPRFSYRTTQAESNRVSVHSRPLKRQKLSPRTADEGSLLWSPPKPNVETDVLRRVTGPESFASSIRSETLEDVLGREILQDRSSYLPSSQAALVLNLPTRPKLGRPGPIDREWVKFYADGGIPSSPTYGPQLIPFPEVERDQSISSLAIRHDENCLSFPSSSSALSLSTPQDYFPEAGTHYKFSSPCPSLFRSEHVPRSALNVPLPYLIHNYSTVSPASVLSNLSSSLSHLKLDGLVEIIDPLFVQSLSACRYLVSLSLRLPLSPRMSDTPVINRQLNNGISTPDLPDKMANKLVLKGDSTPTVIMKSIDQRERSLFAALSNIGKNCFTLKKLRLDLSDLLPMSQQLLLRKYLPDFVSITKLTLRLSAQGDQLTEFPVLFHILRYRDGQLGSRFHKLQLYNCRSMIKSSFEAASKEQDGLSGFLKQRLGHLKSIVLADCQDLTDEDVLLICQNLPAVQNVYLLNCVNLTENAYKHITEQCKAIQMVHVTSHVFRKRLVSPYWWLRSLNKFVSVTALSPSVYGSIELYVLQLLFASIGSHHLNIH